MRAQHVLPLATALAVVFAVGCDTAVSPMPAAADVDEERGPIGKAEADRGSCDAGGGKLLCGGPGTYSCWCDELCLEYQDCCSDAAPLCGIGDVDDDGGDECEGKQQQSCVPACAEEDKLWQIDEASITTFDIDSQLRVDADVALASTGEQLALLISTHPNQDGPVVSSLQYAVAPVDGAAPTKFQLLSGDAQTSSHWYKAAASKPGEGLALVYNEWRRDSNGSVISRDLYFQGFGPDAQPDGDRISLGAASHPSIAATEKGYVAAYDVSSQVEVAFINPEGIETSRIGPHQQSWKHPRVATHEGAVWVVAADKVDDDWGARFYEDLQPVELFNDAGFLPMQAVGDLPSTLAVGGGSVAWAASPHGRAGGIAIAPGDHFTELEEEYLSRVELVWAGDHFVAVTSSNASLRIYRVDVDGTVELQQEVDGTTSGEASPLKTAFGSSSDLAVAPTSKGLAFMTTDEFDVRLASLVRVCPEP
ncbi:MAG: hypothetical protein AAF721_24375 [Myxococcota bacterium]